MEKIEEIHWGAYYNYSNKSRHSNHVIRPIEKNGPNGVNFYLSITESFTTMPFSEFKERTTFLKEATPGDLKQFRRTVDKLYKMRYGYSLKTDFGAKEIKKVETQSVLIIPAGKSERKIFKENLKMLKEANGQLLERFRIAEDELLKATIKDEKRNAKRTLKQISKERKAVRDKIKVARSAVAELKNG